MHEIWIASQGLVTTPDFCCFPAMITHNTRFHTFKFFSVITVFFSELRTDFLCCRLDRKKFRSPSGAAGKSHVFN
jgi:hypothetical protein